MRLEVIDSFYRVLDISAIINGPDCKHSVHSHRREEIVVPNDAVGLGQRRQDGLGIGHVGHRGWIAAQVAIIGRRTRSR